MNECIENIVGIWIGLDGESDALVGRVVRFFAA